jgi:hypothetical protein
LFASLFSKAVVRIFLAVTNANGDIELSLDAERVAARVANHPDVFERFADVKLSYVIDGNPAKAKQVYPEADYFVAAASLTHSMELFVLGHEYGHLVHGHLDGSRVEVAAALPNAIDAKPIEYSWEQEYEADDVGLVLCIATMNERLNSAPATSHWGQTSF